MSSNETPLPLLKQCILAVIGHSPTYSAEYLALVPPRIRTVLALNLTVHDLHRVQQSPLFVKDLSVGAVDELWKRRYKTTLAKFSNISSLELDVEIHHPNQTLSLSWEDRYLMACLLNIPRQTINRQSLPPWGIGIYGITDITFSDGQIYKEAVNSTKYALHCQGKSDISSEVSSNFISIHYKPLLDGVKPFNQSVGSEWPIIERIKVFQQVFPGWTPPYIPVHYDKECVPTELCSEIKRIIVYSHWQEMLINEAITKDDERPLALPGSFEEFCKTHSNTLDTIILLPPAIQKDREGQLCPLSITSTTLTKSIITSVPSLKHLSISMTNIDTNCLEAFTFSLSLSRHFSSQNTST